MKAQLLSLSTLIFAGIGLANSLSVAADGIPVSSGFGLDTMAPEGRWAARLETRTNRYETRFNDAGKREDMDAAFDRVNLDQSIFPALALLGPGTSLGTTHLDTRVENSFAILTLGYGITTDITIGAIIPYARSHTRAKFSVDGGNVGFNPAFDPSAPIGPGNFPFAPVGGAVIPMGTSGVRQLLSNPAFGYGYKPIQDARSSGLGDPTAGVLWRFHKTEKQSAILGLGLRFGIAMDDDPDNLLDVPPGDGSTDIRARFEYFRDIGAGFDFHLLADYNIQTADQVTMRVPVAGQLLASAASKEKLDRNLGDFFETDLELGYRWSDWRVSATWHRYQEQQDYYRSRRGTDTSALENDTWTRADQYRLSATWSGIQAWQQGKLPMPLIVKLEMQDTFGGNNFVGVRDFYLQITSFF